MLVSDYRVFITDDGDGVITFIQNDIINKVLIPKSNTIAKEIFDRYYDQLSNFKYKFNAIVKWIVRDLRKEGYSFKIVPNNQTVYVPVHKNIDELPLKERLSKQEKLHLFYYEMEMIKKKLSKTPLENEY